LIEIAKKKEKKKIEREGINYVTYAEIKAGKRLEAAKTKKNVNYFTYRL